MIEQTKWIERKFNFDFPVALAPVILERIRGAVPRIEAVTSGLPSELLITQTDGKWSIQEQIGHLHDLDALHDGRIDDYLAGKSELRAADMANAKSKAAGHNDLSYSEVLDGLRRSRIAFIDRVEELDTKDFERIALHPRLQKQMRLVDMLLFVAEHDDHHISMMRNILKRLSDNTNSPR
ncbi:MAG: DinB family protein [Candidatus Zixiibacteriota bacterium]